MEKKVLPQLPINISDWRSLRGPCDFFGANGALLER